MGSCADRIVCRCLKVTEDEIISTIRIHGVRNLVELRQVSRAGDGCTCCHKELRAYLNVYAQDLVVRTSDIAEPCLS